jgi:hypothetical protein
MYTYIDETCCENECFSCHRRENQMDDVKYWLKYMLIELYDESNFDSDEFERCLAELCAVVEVKLPSNELKIQKPLTIPYSVESWKQLNNKYFNKLITQ